MPEHPCRPVDRDVYVQAEAILGYDKIVNEFLMLTVADPLASPGFGTMFLYLGDRFHDGATLVASAPW